MDPAQAAREIWQAITDLFFSAENQSRFIDTAHDLGLTPPMLKALLELDPGTSYLMRDLAEQWQCDASFVTVVVDGLEHRGYARRRVAPHDRRAKTVQLTAAGVDVREQAMAAVYGPRAGFWELTVHEQVTLARLLRKLADAQAVHDEGLVAECEDPAARRPAGPRVGHAGRRGRGMPARQSGRGAGQSWRAHLEAHRQELVRLRDEIARVRDEVKAQVRQPVDDAKAVRDDVKAEAKAVRDDVKAEVKAQLKGRRRSG